ncbi:MAG: hypothetical protein M3083_21135 [Actinomycetota bacterium]|nr:hypothetical protein [Actinomycetota bacterium]
MTASWTERVHLLPSSSESTGPSPTDPSPTGPSPTGHPDPWVAVLEFSRSGADRPHLVDEVDTVLDRLGQWDATALWHTDRYAIQLQILATGPEQAVHSALAYHRDAERAVGVAPAAFVRIEVFTAERLEQLRHDGEPSGTLVVPRARHGFVCEEVYAATRMLLAAATAVELVDTLAWFVTAVGGRVEPGPARRSAGMIGIDISLEGDQAHHATAHCFSVAGLILEQALPSVIVDARFAFTRLSEHLPEPNLPA